MASRGSKRTDTGHRRNWLVRLGRRVFGFAAAARATTPETWEDDDYRSSDTDEETAVDPLRDDSSDPSAVSQQVGISQSPEAPLPDDTAAGAVPSLPDNATAQSESEGCLKSPPDTTPAPLRPLDPRFVEQPTDPGEKDAPAEQASITEPTATAVHETSEDDDILDSDDDDETAVDPRFDTSPESQPIAENGESPKTMESRPPGDTPVGGSASSMDGANLPSGLESCPKSTPDTALVFPRSPVPSSQEQQENPRESGTYAKREFKDESDLEDCDPVEYLDDPDIEAMDEHAGSAVDSDIEIPDYDGEARQRIWIDVDDTEDGADSPLPARQKAAEIVSHLFFTSKREQDAVLLLLIDLFQRRDHHATYRAILAAVDSGVSSETLQNMVALRDIWDDRPEWWLSRYGWGRNVRPLPNGSTSLTWKSARSICEARSDFPPECMIDEGWLHEWLCLPPGSSEYWSFPQFVSMKVMAVDQVLQYAPGWQDFRQHETDEFGDVRYRVKMAINDVARSTIGC